MFIPRTNACFWKNYQKYYIIYLIFYLAYNLQIHFRKEAILALGCFCLRSPEDARTHMLLLLQATHIDVSEVRIAAISTVIDLLMRHGLAAFITNTGAFAGNDEHNVSGTEGEFSETGSSIETALDSDMATRGAALSQAELNAQVCTFVHDGIGSFWGYNPLTIFFVSKFQIILESENHLLFMHVFTCFFYIKYYFFRVETL